jgi:hypothetical protein
MAASPFTNGTWPTAQVADTRPTTTLNSDERQAVVSLNALLPALTGLLAAEGGADVAMTTGTLGIGTTVTLATGAQVISINGVKTAIAAQTAQAFGALGTIPEDTWGVIGVERVGAGTTTFTSGANNYTTGYATEALAIAALPAQTADKVRVGYLTILADTGDWVAGTDALAGGTGGTPAAETNYYNTAGAVDTANPLWTAVFQVANQAGTVISSTAG